MRHFASLPHGIASISIGDRHYSDGMNAADISTMAEDLGFIVLYDEFHDNDVLGVNERMKLIRSHLPKNEIVGFRAGNAMSLFDELEKQAAKESVVFYDLDDDNIELEKTGYLVMFPNTQTDLVMHYKLSFGVGAA